jgi:hypothetical protein
VNSYLIYTAIFLSGLCLGALAGAFFMSLFKQSAIKALRMRLGINEFWHRRYLDATQFISPENLRKLRKMAVK